MDSMKTENSESTQATKERLKQLPDIWKRLAGIAVLAALYFALGRLGLLFSFTRPSITPVWLPSGIALAALLVCGYRIWPGVLLGALAVELTAPSGPLTAVFLAVSNTLEGLAGAWLANRYANGRNFYRHPRDVMKFVVLVGMLTPLISPPLGVRVISWDRFILWASDVSTGLIWWLGDVVSVVVLAPLIITWSGQRYRPWNLPQALEFALLLSLLVVLGEAVFGQAAPASLRGYLFTYLCLPLLFWAAFRFGEREMMTATCTLGGVVMWDTLHGYGLFEQFEREKALLVYQAFMATASVMSLCLAAVVGQRRRATEQLQKARDELELRVQQRTKALEAQISERRLAEEALQRSEATLRGILDAAKESIWLFSPDGEILLGNATALERFGSVPSQLLGRHFNDLMPAEVAEGRITRLREVVESRLPVEFEDRGGNIMFHHSFCPVLDRDGRVNSIACFSRDITPLRQVEQALRASQERLELAQQAGHIGTFDRNLRTGETIWSEEMNALCGLPVGSRRVSFAEWEEAIHPEDLPRIRDSIRSGIANCSSFQMEFRLYWPDRSLHWIEARGKVVCDEHGLPLRTVGVNMDITERRQLQHALEEANRELQTANGNLKVVTEQLRLVNETLERRVEEQTAELRQTNQILRMISECNQVLVHISDERKLSEEICRVINDVGGYRMAWVGVAEFDEARTVRPFAAVGLGEGYIDKIKVSWGENRLGLGPTGTAVRTGKVCLGKDFLNDPNLEPWRKLALEQGFRSSVALPLLTKNRAFGALTIYSSEPDAFDQKQVSLLTDLAEDMAFGITSLRARAERDRAREELEQKTMQLQALGLQLVHAEQQERRRLAQILHDSLQQLLVGARYNLELLRRQGREQDFEQTVRRIDGFLAECIQVSRSLTAQLSPPILYEAGLASALRWLGRWFYETHGLTVRIEATEEMLSEPEDVRFAIFYAVRELLFNVVKHAKVKQSQVRVKSLKQQVRILVSDKGVGFDSADLHAKKSDDGGLGLFSLRERLELLGGTLAIKSSFGRGTRFTMTVPLRRGS